MVSSHLLQDGSGGPTSISCSVAHSNKNPIYIGHSFLCSRHTIIMGEGLHAYDMTLGLKPQQRPHQAEYEMRCDLAHNPIGYVSPQRIWAAATSPRLRLLKAQISTLIKTV